MRARLRLAPAILAAGACALAAGAARAGSDDAHDAKFGLTGDWGGARTRLKDAGWTVQVREKFEAAGNPQGGDRKLGVGAGELRLGVSGDLEKAIGLRGGKVQLTFTDRHGSSLGPSAGLDPLQPFIEVHGRGDRWRLTQFWYEQTLGVFALKLGRVNPGSDFDAFACDFENLTFCGSTPGNLAGDYWFNAPVSQWGARAKLTFGDEAGYVEAGAYEINPRNLHDGFTLGFGGGEGTLIPVEAAWTPKLGAAGLPGTYLVGGWYSTADADDVLLAADRAPIPLTDAPALRRANSYGAYLSFEQQVSGEPDGPGVTLFLNATQTDRRTTRLDRQVAAGVAWKGALAAQPDDEIALAVGATHVNGRAARAERLAGKPEPGSETAVELDYRFQGPQGLTVMPNLQYVRHPGGLDRTAAVVAGLKVVVGL